MTDAHRMQPGDEHSSLLGIIALSVGCLLRKLLCYCRLFEVTCPIWKFSPLVIYANLMEGVRCTQSLSQRALIKFRNDNNTTNVI